MKGTILSAAIVAYLAAGFVWPTLRGWQRHRVWPIVFNRRAAPAQRLLGVMSGVLLLGVLLVAILLIVPGPAGLGLRTLPAWVDAIGWAGLCVGALLTVVAQHQMGASWRVGIDERPTDLVTTGLFAYIRNPIFTGLLLFLAAVVLLAPVWWSAGVWALTLVGIRVQVGWEESHLVAHHGESYLAYARQSGRFVPGWNRPSVVE